MFSLAVAHLMHQLDSARHRVVAVDAMADNLAYPRASVTANGFPGHLVTLVHNCVSDM